MDIKHPKVIGTIAAPKHRGSLEGSKAGFCRDIVSKLQPGRATILEFETRDEVLKYQNTFSTVTTNIKWDTAGKRVWTQRADNNRLMVWLREAK